MAKSTKKPCIQYAMHYLSRYPKTEKEMRVKLLEKGYSEKDIDETMHYLVHSNYIDDKQFAESYLNSEVVRKGKPIDRVKAKLYEKQIDATALHEALEELDADILDGMQRAIAKDIDKRKQKGEDPLDIIQKLQRRGYHFGLIKKTIEQRASGELDY